MHARLALSILFFVMGAAAHADGTHWQQVMAGDRKVGFVQHSRRVADGHVFESEMLTLELGKSGRRVTYQVRIDTESTADGALVRLLREARTREGHSRLEARVAGADLVIDIGPKKQAQSRTLTGAGVNLKTDEFARAWRQSAGSGVLSLQPLAFTTFDAVKAAPVEVELSTVPVTEPPYRIRRLVRASGGEFATFQALNPRGEVIEESLRLGGLRLALVGASESEAKTPNQVLDHVVGQFQKSPYRIPVSGARGKIRYGFDNGGRAPRIPVGGGQRSWADGQTTWIQVCAQCSAEDDARDAGTLTEAQRTDTLRPTPWMNFDDPSFKARARRAAAGSSEPGAIMRRLTEYVRGHMSVEQIDMLGYGSALEAFKSRRGDCTEYAVLLAAMGRAQGVPTRVVSGLVYARQFEGQRHVFVPHVWVHAWTGTGWRSFDAALERFDSTHLAFAASDDGNPAELFAGLNLAHELRLTSAARVLPRKPAQAN